MKVKSFISFFFLLVSLFILGTSGVSARTIEYNASFICGVDPPPAVLRVLPGIYATSITVINPGRSTVTIDMRVSLTFPHGPNDPFDPGAVSDVVEVQLEPNQAFNIDCEELPFDFPFTDDPSGPPYFQGVVSIESSRRVRVSAIHTAGTPEGNVSSISVENIEGRFNF